MKVEKDLGGNKDTAQRWSKSYEDECRD